MGKRGKEKKVHPDDDITGYSNGKIAMTTWNESKRQNNVLTSAEPGRWSHYVTTRRQVGQSGNGNGGTDRRKTGGMGLHQDLQIDNLKDEKISHDQMVIRQHNRNLIEYFAHFGNTYSQDDSVDLNYVSSLLEAGGDVNCCDKYGQTLLHEASRSWHVDVARFLIENGADPNRGDNFDRLPLHVAAAVDYPEMVNMLIEYGTDMEATTRGEEQTPVHFAAKNDACKSLKALIKKGCLYKWVRDYKERTPLHLAAELDRSETARMLLELDDPAPAEVEDRCGQTAIAWMICKMPPVAKLALDQFHRTDRANRKQSYHLHKLETRSPDKPKKGHPRSPMQNVVIFKRFDLIEHPVFLYLIAMKWKLFGRFGAVITLLVNCAFIISWTLLGCLVEYDVRYLYVLPSQWWRIVIGILAMFFTGWQVKDEMTEYISSRQKHNKWEEWRLAEIDLDLKYSHPRWPDEAKYLKEEKKNIENQRPQYFNDFWNIFDWLCYFLLLVCVITHIIDIAAHSDFVARLHIRLMSVAIILIWIRILKNARAFAYLGPFIVIITHMLGDIMKFTFLYLVFYFPFSCAFWMLYGGPKIPEQYQGRPDGANHTVQVIGMDTYDALLFSLFRITLVDNYDYEGMKSVDSLMADLLCGGWLALSAILMLNTFIALLSDTFQRVYDNAKANAVMQKAITIMGIEETLNQKRTDKFLRTIQKKYAPKELPYDDDELTDGGDDLKKVTIQIKEQLDEFEATVNQHLLMPKDEKKTNNNGNSVDCVSGEVFHQEINALRQDMKHQQDKMMNRFKQEMKAVKELLSQISDQNSAVELRGDTHSGGQSFEGHAGSHPSDLPPRPSRPSASIRRRSTDRSPEDSTYILDQPRRDSYRSRGVSDVTMSAQFTSPPYDVRPYVHTDFRSGSIPNVEVSDQNIST